MNHFTPSGLKVNHDRDMDYSTRYDDRELTTKKNLTAQLDWLEQKLHNEIMLCSHDVLKLERLEERYWSDGLAAAAHKDFPYRMRYIEAHEHVTLLIHSHYKELPTVI